MATSSFRVAPPRESAFLLSRLRIARLAIQGDRCAHLTGPGVDDDLPAPELIRDEDFPTSGGEGEPIRKGDPLDGSNPAKAGVFEYCDPVRTRS
jgi:hypothetical protein